MKAIRYNNAQEREWAIAQAERMGYKKWEENDKHRKSEDNCIYLNGVVKDWVDDKFKSYFPEIPLQ